ncbi:MAG: OsmC family protein [Oribacterium sp.]
MLMTFKAKAVKTKTGLQVESDARGFRLIMDEPEEMGGANTGLNPVEAVLCALGSCQAIVAAAFAEANDFKYDEFHVELEGDLDPDGMMGLSDVRKGFQEVRFSMHFKTEEPQEKCEAFADFIESRCPVGDILKNGVKLVRTGVVKD